VHVSVGSCWAAAGIGDFAAGAEGQRIDAEWLCSEEGK
jgi:hypothetical protein